MSRHHSRHDELDALIHALCEGQITAEQSARLEALILADPEAEARYIVAMNFQADLIRSCSEMPQVRAASSSAAMPRRRHRVQRIAGLVAIGTTAAVVAAASLFPMGNPQPHIPAFGGAGVQELAGTAVGIEATHDSVAVLTQVLRATWDEMGLAVHEGTPLPVGRLKLRSGLARVEFYCGAVVILEGPADLELISANRAFCHGGKLRAHVPKHAHGFTIESPELDLIDLGTEFGMTVGKRTEVSVFDGVVELQEHGPGRKTAASQRLTTGAELGIDETGVHHPIEKPVRYVSADELAVRAAAESARQFKNWRRATEALRSDPSLLALYTFEPENAERSWNHTLHDETRSSREPNDATVIGCERGTGRWPGKGALEFHRVSDRVRLQIPGEFDSLTLMTWVRIDGLDNVFNSLLMSDGSKLGEIHWQLEQQGTVKLGLQCIPEGKYPGPVVFQPDHASSWVHLAVVYDHARATVTHFVNGQALRVLPMKPRIKARIGSAEIGNWSLDAATVNQPIRNLNGAIDSFAILSRALSADEVLQQYSSGVPRT